MYAVKTISKNEIKEKTIEDLFDHSDEIPQVFDDPSQTCYDIIISSKPIDHRKQLVLPPFVHDETDIDEILRYYTPEELIYNISNMPSEFVETIYYNYSNSELAKLINSIIPFSLSLIQAKEEFTICVNENDYETFKTMKIRELFQTWTNQEQEHACIQPTQPYAKFFQLLDLIVGIEL